MVDDTPWTGSFGKVEIGDLVITLLQASDVGKSSDDHPNFDFQRQRTVTEGSIPEEHRSVKA